MGISVSYDWVMQIEERLSTAICKRFENDGAVAPTILRKGLFTVGALDNLYRNPSSTMSKLYRLELVWDAYRPDCLKESTREKRGKGMCKKLPTNWHDFLFDHINKNNCLNSFHHR